MSVAIFRNADTIEQLAQLARRKRRQDASAARGGPLSPLSPLKTSPRCQWRRRPPVTMRHHTITVAQTK